jgi:uncharacterized damage-inducible protein DinB
LCESSKLSHLTIWITVLTRGRARPENLLLCSALLCSALLVSAQQSCIELCKSRKSLYSGLRWKEPASFGPLPELIAAYERDHNLLAEQLRGLDDESWIHQAWLIEDDTELLLKNTVGGLLWIALFDFVHHRGQLSTYIRPMGGKVPASTDLPLTRQLRHKKTSERSIRWPPYVRQRRRRPEKVISEGWSFAAEVPDFRKKS